MEKLSSKKRIVCLVIISILLVIVVFCISVSLIKKIQQNRIDNVVENKIYGTVLETGKNYIKVKAVDDDEYIIRTSEKSDLGDFIVVYYKESESEVIEPNEIEVIADKNEIVINTEKTTTTTSTTATTMVSSTTTTTITENDDESILDVIKEKYDNLDKEEIKENAKNNFIMVVDFIFYEGEINGVTWDSLKMSTKAKVIYYALLMDGKIESKWPDYKNNISSKYNDIKSKMVAKYMEITTSICSEHPDECDVTRNDFAILKASLGLTWDVIKNAFKYAYDKGVSYLVEWYEVYSGKR